MLRTLAPEDDARYASLYDDAILNCFRELFGIPDEASWNSRLHRLDYDMWVRQARLPQRLGGCGLRDSNRILFAAFWASWADSLPIIIERFPNIGNRILHLITDRSLSSSSLPPFASAIRFCAQHLSDRKWLSIPI